MNTSSCTAAVVLNYKTADDTFLAVRALLDSRLRPEQIIVVNNDQGAECEEALASVRREISYVANEHNLGFSGGMNVGIRRALRDGAQRVLLLNSDVTITPDCLERLEQALESNPRAGIVGPMVLARSAPHLVASLGLSFNPVTGRMRVLAAMKPRAGLGPAGATHVDAVSGCAMFIRKEVFAAAGLLDEDYFFGFEDLHFCLTARQRGFRTMVVPEAIAYHEGGRSIGAASPRRLYFAARNHLRFASTAAPMGRTASLARGISIVALNLAHALRSQGGSARQRVGAVIRGTRDHIVSRYGPDR